MSHLIIDRNRLNHLHSCFGDNKYYYVHWYSTNSIKLLIKTLKYHEGDLFAIGDTYLEIIKHFKETKK